MESLRGRRYSFPVQRGKWKSCQVTKQHSSPSPYMYVVQSSDGRKLHRNRRHLHASNYRAKNAPRIHGMNLCESKFCAKAFSYVTIRTPVMETTQTLPLNRQTYLFVATPNHALRQDRQTTGKIK